MVTGKASSIHLCLVASSCLSLFRKTRANACNSCSALTLIPLPPKNKALNINARFVYRFSESRKENSHISIAERWGVSPTGSVDVPSILSLAKLGNHNPESPQPNNGSRTTSTAEFTQTSTILHQTPLSRGVLHVARNDYMLILGVANWQPRMQGVADPHSLHVQLQTSPADKRIQNMRLVVRARTMTSFSRASC